MIIIVVGMHRSGTSAIAGLLHSNGIIMGEENNFRPKPSKENIKGFYENYLFRCINDEIVEKCNYEIKSWRVEIPRMKANLLTRYKMRKILKRYNQRYDIWGWKDPRTCLTLGLWLKEMIKLRFIEHYKILYIIRDPFAVAFSMTKRKNTDYETALKLWLVYNEYAMELIKDEIQERTCFLNYENLCQNPVKTSRTISKFINYPLDEDIVTQFIEPKFNRSSVAGKKHTVSKELAEKLRSLKAKLNKYEDFNINS